MLDLRLIAASFATFVALMSVAMADPDKDRLQEQNKDKVQSSAMARPVRVILPASWEPNVKEAGPERDRLLQKGSQADTAAHLDDRGNSPGLSPKNSRRP